VAKHTSDSLIQGKMQEQRPWQLEGRSLEGIHFQSYQFYCFNKTSSRASRKKCRITVHNNLVPESYAHSEISTEHKKRT
jgi:hypothetical protein